MGLFSKTKQKSQPQKRAPYRKMDTDQAEKELDFKRKREASDKVAKIVKDDPDAEREYISKLLGIEIKAPDPDKKYKQEIKTRIAKEALDEINADPVLRKEFARRQVAELIGEPVSRDDSGDGNQNYSDPVEELLDQHRRMKEFEAELGGGGGNKGVMDLINPGVLDGIAKILTALKAQQPAQEEPYYVVRVDGKTAQVPKSQYDKLLSEGRLAPVAELQSPKPKPEEIKSGEPVQATTDYPQLPPFLKGFDFNMIHEWLELEPEEFVAQLKNEVAQGADESKLVWGFLTTATYEGIVGMITPYKNNPEVSALIERALSVEGKEWLENVLQLVKGAK